ncbi:MAG: fused MFS/spermidine synthase [Magnetococcales bacterium]|nr:fused MFS/spermidine synthase [Magnetococcales bacterium]
MMIEILGSRVVGPYYGVGLYVWTSLITVTLLALAGGYLLGGRLADRGAAERVLGWPLLLAGGFVLGLPLWKGVVLTASHPLGLRLGALTSTLALFGPPLVALGCVTPLIVKIAAPERERLGRVVGGLTAISTLGSVVGTVATGFFLIPAFGVERIFQLGGTLLVLLGVACLWRARRSHLLLPLVLLAVPGWLAGEEPVTFALADGSGVRVVEARHSFYGHIKVVDVDRGVDRQRLLLIDGLNQGGVAPGGLSVTTYPYFLCFLSELLAPSAADALVIGLGAGLVPRCLEKNRIHVEVVEIDPVIVDLAARHFDFRPGERVHLADARHFLASGNPRHDLVVMDAFSGETTPGHLLDLEAMRLVKARLRPGGFFFMNLIGTLRPGNPMVPSVVHTLRRVFDQVELVPLFEAEEGSIGNLIVMAYDGPLRVPDHALVNGRPVHGNALEVVNRFLARRYHFPAGTPALLLTDDYSPLEFHDAWAKEELRKRLMESDLVQALYRL